MNRILLLLLFFPFLSYGQKAGDLISFEKNLDLTPSGVKQWFAEKCSPEDAAQATFSTQNKYGLQGYKLTYYTTDYGGRLVEAYGEVLIPVTNKKLSTIIDCHATLTSRTAAPSNLGGDFVGQFLVGPVLLSLNDYIVVAPDYIGYGDSVEDVRFTHEQSTVDATLDMYKASQTFLDKINLERYDETFLTGYSLGAHAAMGVLKKTQKENTYKFKYTTLGGGPYDLNQSTFNNGILDKKYYITSAFLAFVMNAADGVGYNVFDGDFRNVIHEDYYDKYIENVIDGKLGVLWGPLEWRKLFKPEFVKKIESNPNHPIYQYLTDNSNYDWYNQSPTHVVHGAWDLIIHPSNTSKAFKTQRSYYPWYDMKKYQIKRTNMGPFTHITGVFPYTMIALYDFNTRRKGGYFNLRAETRSPLNIELRRSSVAPNLYANNELLPSTLELINSSNRNDSKGSFYIKSNIEGEEYLLPAMIEEAQVLENNEAFTIFAENLEVRNPETQYINVWRNKSLVTSQQSKTLDTNNLQANDLIEIVTPDAIFTTIYLANENIYSAYSNQNNITITGKAEIESIEAYDTTGKQLYSMNNIVSKNHDFRTEAKGLIILNIKDIDGNNYTAKVIKH